jgi:hypothetical protein
MQLTNCGTQSEIVGPSTGKQALARLKGYLKANLNLGPVLIQGSCLMSGGELEKKRKFKFCYVCVLNPGLRDFVT